MWCRNRRAPTVGGVREQDEDAAWRTIVENYGERATLEDEPTDGPAEGSADTGAGGCAAGLAEGPVEGTARAQEPDAEQDSPEVEPVAPALDERADEPPYSAVLDAPEENFVPPPPPPLPRPRGPLGLAWLGLLGSPALLLVFILTGTAMPQLISWGLVAAFLGGFLYLVWHLPNGPRDPFDDGARI